MPNTLVMIHGYSDGGESFETWRRRLQPRYENTQSICICDYVSLTNEVTLKDLAEGFDLALSTRPGLSAGESFDAIVHSTGMLVIRAWLQNYAARRSRLKHLIGIAPATFGSPLAKKGRSWIGSVFKGSKHLGPDFLNAGDLVLDALELGSPYTWDLAEQDLVGPNVCYDDTNGTPYVYIFCGAEAYGGLRGIATRRVRTARSGRPGQASTHERSKSISLNRHRCWIREIKTPRPSAGKSTTGRIRIFRFIW